MDKGHTEFNWSECYEAEVELYGFGITGGDPAPVLQLIEELLDQVAPAVFYTSVRLALAGMTASAGSGVLLKDGSGVVAAVSEKRFDLITDHSEQRHKAVNVVR